MLIFCIIWVLIGILAVWVTFHTARKRWYDTNREEFWKGIGADNALSVLIIFSPIYISGGPFALLLLFCFEKKYFTFYFKSQKL